MWFLSIPYDQLGGKISGYLEQGIQTSMAQGRSTEIILIIKWIRTSRLSINNSLPLLISADGVEGGAPEGCEPPKEKVYGGAPGASRARNLFILFCFFITLEPRVE